MLIALDYNAALRQIAGIGRYTRELVSAFLRLQSGDHLVLFYAARDLAPDHWGLRDLRALQGAFPAVRAVPIPLSERMLTILWQRARVPLPVEHWTGPIDLLHAPDFVLPPVRRAPTLLTVHDLTFRIHPETAHANLRRYLDWAVPRSLRHATHILADSNSTKADLQRLMRVDPARVTVLYPGVDPRFRRVTEQVRLDQIKARYELPERFLFFIGTIEPRKNLIRLIEAFGQLDQPDLHLVLAGKPGWLSDPILARVQQTARIRLLGPVPEDDLPALYTLASASVYPSLYEGFGFPPLESLACGTPTVATNTSSLPEIVGDLGVLVDPLSVSSIRSGLEQALNDHAWRDRISQHGPAHAAQWTWERSARQLLGLYRRFAVKDEG